MTTLLLDTHVLQWWSAEPERLSKRAAQAVAGAAELAVAGITWWELAWLVTHGRIIVALPVASWLEQLAGQVRTVGITPAIAATAVSLPTAFPGDPADRLIFASAVEQGWSLVTKDKRLREHPHPRKLTIW